MIETIILALVTVCCVLAAVMKDKQDTNKRNPLL